MGWDDNYRSDSHRFTTFRIYVLKAHFLNVAIGVQEWGDRSMLATIALGAAQVGFGTGHLSMFKILPSTYLPVNFIIH